MLRLFGNVEKINGNRMTKCIYGGMKNGGGRLNVAENILKKRNMRRGKNRKMIKKSKTNNEANKERVVALRRL